MLRTAFRIAQSSAAAFAVLALSTSMASGAVVGRSSDPVGDVTVRDSHMGQPERDTVDIRRVTYVLTARRVTIITTVVNLSVNKYRRQFFETTARGGPEPLVLSTEMGSDTVEVLDGSSTPPSCRGSAASFDLARSEFRQSVPLRCLSDSDAISLRSKTTLYRSNGSVLTADRAVRTEQLLLG